MALIHFLFLFSGIFILYVYLGYPAFIAYLAFLVSRQNKFEEILPKITLIIPAYNEEKHIAKKLENTLALDYPRDKTQILVVSDGSTDRTSELVKAFSNQGVELLHDPERKGKMAAIVRAIQVSQGDIIIFSDANNLYDKDAIRELVLPFSDPAVGATTGAKLIIEDGRDLSSAEGLYWKYESLIKNSESKIDSCVSSVGEILAIRRNLFVAPKTGVINDDHYIVLDIIRRGYRSIYTPKARSFEYVSHTAADEFVRRRRMNAGLFQTIAMSASLLPLNRPLLIWQIVSHKYLRALVPFAMILMMGTNIVLAFDELGRGTAPNFYTWTLFAQICFYSLAIIGSLVKFRGLLGKVIYLPAFLVNSNLAALAGLGIYLTDRQPHIWKSARR
jgi:cellulose synthase/poly-beta-1,6-N-acetylglucosamine synthase-like glycosyltransferase